jgi:methylmalonyl-CoA mutase N-terminal domain/subunit
MRLITDTFQYCHQHLPQWNTISISGYHIREAGATAVQEVAFTLSNAIAYVLAAVESGLDVDHFAPQLTFFFSSDKHFLEEVAKFRAARRLWARIMRQRFGAKKQASWRLRFHTQTAGSALTAQQPENNVVRVALQALAAVLGGTQSLHTNSMDEALGLPTEEAVRIALRTQQIIAHETGVADTVDPLGGSYAIEQLTDEIEQAVESYLRKIEAMGGALVAIKEGFIQHEIHQAAYEAHKKIERKEDIVVGVNQFETEEGIPIKPLQVDPAIETQQRQRLAAVRERRDRKVVDRLLSKLTQAVEDGENLLPRFVECVENDVTLGEICGTLRALWGEYQQPITL